MTRCCTYWSDAVTAVTVYQANFTVGQATASGLGALDLALENLGVLPTLTPPPALSPEAQKEFDAVREPLVGMRVNLAC